LRPAQPIPLRAPHTLSNLIDLTTNYNTALTESWQPTLALDEIDLTLASLPAGVHTLAGIPFDVRGIIRLSRPAWGHARFPVRVEVQMDRKFRWLHVLHGADTHARQGEQIGSYRLHYRDGGSNEFTIIYGRDLWSWRNASRYAAASVDPKNGS
jgi:hypothetical protein